MIYHYIIYSIPHLSDITIFPHWWHCPQMLPSSVSVANSKNNLNSAFWTRKKTKKTKKKEYCNNNGCFIPTIAKINMIKKKRTIDLTRYQFVNNMFMLCLYGLAFVLITMNSDCSWIFNFTPRFYIVSYGEAAPSKEIKFPPNLSFRKIRCWLSKDYLSCYANLNQFYEAGKKTKKFLCQVLSVQTIWTTYCTSISFVSKVPLSRFLSMLGWLIFYWYLVTRNW